MGGRSGRSRGRDGGVEGVRSERRRARPRDGVSPVATWRTDRGVGGWLRRRWGVTADLCVHLGLLRSNGTKRVNVGNVCGSESQGRGQPYRSDPAGGREGWRQPEGPVA